MKETNARPRTHLFSLQVWREAVGTEQTEVRGKVQLLSTGETRYFREWTALVPLLITMLSEEEEVQSVQY
jgi:hypothetical protein